MVIDGGQGLRIEPIASGGFEGYDQVIGFQVLHRRTALKSLADPPKSVPQIIACALLCRSPATTGRPVSPFDTPSRRSGLKREQRLRGPRSEGYGRLAVVHLKAAQESDFQHFPHVLQISWVKYSMLADVCTCIACSSNIVMLYFLSHGKQALPQDHPRGNTADALD